MGEVLRFDRGAGWAGRGLAFIGVGDGGAGVCGLQGLFQLLNTT